MSNIKFDDATKQEITARLQKYFNDELQQELGSFDAEFLLDFFAENVGNHFYNQALADALKTFEARIDDFNESIYALEKDTSTKSK